MIIVRKVSENIKNETQHYNEIQKEYGNLTVKAYSVNEDVKKV